MMKILATSLILLTSSLLHGQSIKELKWLAGTWERTNVRQGQTAFEVWEKSGKEKLTGQGITMRGADTVFIEKLSIITKEDELFYVAEVSQNQEPTLFKITSITKNRFVCENPDHDFPKKIAYTLKGNELTAVISGNGKEMGFIFKRAD